MANEAKKVEFQAVLGYGNDVLPGEVFTLFRMSVHPDHATFSSVKNEKYMLDYSAVSEAAFSIYTMGENLWFSCLADGKRFCFSASPKDWKSEEGKKFLSEIKHRVKIENLKGLDAYCGDSVPSVFFGLLEHL